MAWDGDMRHLTSIQIQEFLDRQLPPREEAVVQAHLAVCPRCQSEVETWGMLFTDLSNLPELAPGQTFRQDVLEGTPAREPLVGLAQGWAAARKARRQEEAHIPQGSIQDYLENLLPAQPRARLEAHLGSCTSCSQQVEEWQTLLGAIRPLGHFSPSQGFAERVMTKVMVPTPVPAPVPVRVASGWLTQPGRALAWIRGLLPTTRHGWAVAGGLASAPTITMAALMYMLFSRPLLTPAAFGSYMFWKVSVLLESLVSIGTSMAMESGTLAQLYAFIGPVAQSPLLLGVGGVFFSLLSAGALWVLYRNLIVTPSDNRYARARV